MTSWPPAQLPGLRVELARRRATYRTRCGRTVTRVGVDCVSSVLAAAAEHRAACRSCSLSRPRQGPTDDG
ncbi:hypothetical protein [Streptomyces calidiresistens]|uniref:Uncharacterized protein n=1 Tax=Streptomyces calidiresistens TaxID=1485586 RepID=A0A7W3T6K1_9ACTN|nr:hypothetical protein [Streptomyces calidiresistens]MBB0231887.1 hypothetical protein [Streptomyces calidiresistens]